MKFTTDISNKTVSGRAYSKLIWEKLFRLVQAEKWPTFQCFLCDLWVFQTCLEHGNTSFYWQYDAGTGETFVTIHEQVLVRGTNLECLLVEVIPGKKIVISTYEGD